MAIYTFSEAKLTALGKKGINKPDADGYYTLLVGALNCSNNSGAWRYNGGADVIALFGPGSSFQRKIVNGTVYAEVTHPIKTSAETENEFQRRYLDIDPRNRAAHFRKVWLDTDFGRNNPQYNNPTMIGIYAEVKPCAPHGAILKEALDDPNQNVCFSIRSVADQALVGGKLERNIIEVITFDFVNEGGIQIASKWDTPATESLDFGIPRITAGTVIDKEILKSIASSKGQNVFSMESVDTATYLLGKYFKEEAPKIHVKW